MTRTTEITIFVISVVCLGAFVMPRFSSSPGAARLAAAKTQLTTFEAALDLYREDTGSYPKGKRGLNNLVERPLGPENWKGPYLPGEIPLDPWGNAFIYRCPGNYNRGSYDLMSMGPDGRVGGGDDIANWKMTVLRNDSNRQQATRKL